MKLYEMATEFERLMELAVDPETGEFSEEFGPALEKLGADFEDKVIGCAQVLKTMAYKEGVVAAEQDRLAKRKKAYANAQDRLKQYIAGCMDRADVKKVERPTMSVSRTKGRDKVEMKEGFDTSAMPEEVLHPAKPREPNKKYLLEQLKAGKKYDFAKIVRGDGSISVK
jgi:hypothetical protein